MRLGEGRRLRGSALHIGSSEVIGYNKMFYSLSDEIQRLHSDMQAELEPFVY